MSTNVRNREKRTKKTVKVIRTGKIKLGKQNTKTTVQVVVDEKSAKVPLSKEEIIRNKRQERSIKRKQSTWTGVPDQCTRPAEWKMSRRTLSTEDDLYEVYHAGGIYWSAFHEYLDALESRYGQQELDIQEGYDQDTSMAFPFPVVV